ncbi:hypothetical protein [Luteipulveratus halotolerans]|uniref:hypothetical protein n=1 Tax=Luteipulveratus halotolerans TaxID=1631356 RepID=UPI0012F99887|nr:hypothetical protein [Luteipulveratus halotolerans]
MAVQDSLQPGADSSYVLRATRVMASENFPADTVIGVSLANSSAWISRSTSFDEFCVLADITLREIAETPEGASMPAAFPYLRSEHSSLADVNTPYEVASIPLATLSPDDSEETRQAAETLDEVTFETEPATNGTDVALRVSFRGSLSLSCTGRFREEDGRVRLSFVDIQPRDTLTADEVLDAIRHKDLLTVHFASGHSWLDGHLYDVEISDTRFPRWRWSDFSGTDVSREKPGSPYDPDLIGSAGDDSLFGWVVRNFGTSGILTCDDGPGEVADFIHAGEGGVSLIHVKAAHSSSPGRAVSATAYEGVTAQALKNLTHASIGAIASALSRPHPGSRTWIDGVPDRDGRDFMVQWLNDFDQGHPVDVAIVQPHVLESAYRRSVITRDTSNLRVRLLETLLNSARSEVASRAGDLTVYGMAG